MSFLTDHWFHYFCVHVIIRLMSCYIANKYSLNQFHNVI
jgi:hypothetical protein